MVVGNQDTGGTNSVTHPSGIPQDKIDNIMSGIANTGDVKMNNHRKKLRQRFDIIKKLGQGTYGKVQLGINKETGQEVAIKTIKKCKIEAESDLVRIRREVQIMSSVQHPNIIHIYEVFENREKMVLVMEFAAGGELYDYLSERKVLNEEEARRIFRQVATAVYYCHKHKICHRDLKLENILLDEHGNAKIADFGLSNVFDEKRMLATFCGSPLYASPEIVEGTPYHGPEVDCWSLGVLLYTLVYGSMPFDGSNFKRLVKQISQGDYYEPKKPSRASSLIREMLTVCPRKRATIEQICSHWWVNENDNVSCLELAEDLANQTPVRLDVLLSLTPAAVTADQLVVPSADGSGAGGKGGAIPRSHSVGSIRDIAPNTEAERRILDMVAAGGEAALMPSPTRTITPAQSPIQTKRKLENTVSTENATGVALNKKEKPGSMHTFVNEPAIISTVPEEPMPMETESEDLSVKEQLPTTAESTAGEMRNFSVRDIKAVGDLCEKLITDNSSTVPKNEVTFTPEEKAEISNQLPSNKADATEEVPEKTKGATKVIKKFVNKHKTADLVNVIGKIDSEESTKAPDINNKTRPTAESAVSPSSAATKPFVRKCSLQDDTPLNKFTADRRKSRILETAEKFQQMNAHNQSTAMDKPKKLVIPGVSVGNFKKEYERKASTTGQQLTAGERRALEEVAEAEAAALEAELAAKEEEFGQSTADEEANVEASDSKASVSSFSLEDARRSMENSIALIRQAQSESSKDVNNICAKTENITVSEREPPVFGGPETERQQKLKNARAIIGNAIQPVLRRPQTPLACSSYFGNGGGGYEQMRAVSGSYLGLGSNNRNSAELSIVPNPPLLPVSRTLPPPANANANAALAAARQTLMGRLATGGMGNFSQAMNNRSPRLGNEVHAKSLHSMHVPSIASSSPSSPSSLQLPNFTQQHPLLATFAGTATASNANPNANAVSNNTTTKSSTFTNSNVINTNSTPKPFYNASSSTPLWKTSSVSPGVGQSESPFNPQPQPGTMKTSTASITLKSATLPRRKTARNEIQLDIKPAIVEQPAMRFTTEMHHPVADLRSAPPREGPVPYSPIKSIVNARASSLEPKENVLPIHKPPSTYMRTISNSTNRSGSLSRQSTNDSESDTTTTNMSQSTITGSSQPIKKSPREFIIPIAVEGGGFITPREGSIEPSESATGSSRSTFTRLRPTRRIGSLLSETGVDESSPFQKLRTSSTNRDGEDDTRFTLHKLRSSRPVKKISQDNDSQSSGEEDDDDGFEILTAENLFSTLLQRVRALTNRMNVNNDITSGFPSSSRILSNMRQAQSPFWNQDPFGRSKVRYTYSETIEKRQVRLNNAANSMGVPWRHSMSRDMGSDMDSMFSRTGATLPRGKTSDTVTEKSKISLGDEPLDLADLDLSRLRLSKTDLETLSNIAPGLPKCFQEQLLAKLPPTQARKLSRTLSVQTGQNVPTPKVYKRSQSSGRPTTTQISKLDNFKEPETESIRSDFNKEDIIRRQTINGLRSDADNKERLPKTQEECAEKEFCPLYASDINEKYKYYSPYVNKTLRDSPLANSSGSTQKAESSEIPPMLGRPPSGRISPTSVTEASQAKRLSQRRISRVLKTDITEQPLEESPAETQKCVKRDDNETAAENLETATKLKYSRHTRNKSLDAFSDRVDGSSVPQETPKLSRRSLSRPRDTDVDKVNKHELADKILQELQVLSTIRSQQEQRECSVVREIPVERIDETPLPVVKKVKKVKATEKSTESSTDADVKLAPTVTKKIKKIVKKSDSSKPPTSDDIPGTLAENVNKTLTSDLYSPKKISKLKRPKSYPMKDTNDQVVNSEICTAVPLASCATITPNEATIHESPSEATASQIIDLNSGPTRESRLLRPKSYPASKLTAPKELKKVVRRPPADSSVEDKGSNLLTKTDISSSSTPNASSSDCKPQIVESNPTTTLKKTIKVTKKSKLSQPSTVSSNSSTGNTTSSVGDDSKESSPATTIVSVKEKVVEKKPGKGLLYAIGQKFEKLRASATSTSCANIPQQKKTTADGSSPEKTTGKYSFVKKTKSLGSSVAKKNSVEGNSQESNNVPLQKEKKLPAEGKTIKTDKRSRIDLMIRNLRERSVPRAQPTLSTESNYIKRAVSVEEMPGTFNRKSVNKVLGLFKRYEKDSSNVDRIRTARSASNIQRQVADSPCSTPIYQNAEAILKLKDQPTLNDGELKKEYRGTLNCGCELKSPISDESPTSTCPECMENATACMYQEAQNMDLQGTPGNKDRRKGLMLKLMKSEKQQDDENVNAARKSKMYTQVNDNEIYSNLPPYPRTVHSLSSNSSTAQAAENLTNNNNISLVNNNNTSSLNSSQTSGYRLSSLNDCNQNNNMPSPSFDNIANYSSDSRSYQDDCASTTSTFRSPTEEPELYFDNWSICSEDNYRMHGATPSPTVSRLSRSSQVSSPSRRDGDVSDPNESIVDRIRRRSFYCRFNEKKPKRTSSIVGPNAVREYYREQHSTNRTRSSNKINTGERERSPDITQEFFRPLKLSPIGTELKPPVYKSPLSSSGNEYFASQAASRSRKSLSDIRPPPSPSGLTERRYGSFANPDNDLLSHSSILSSRMKSSNTGDETTTKVTSPATSYYSTYNPKRRFSYNMNGTTPPSGSHVSTSGHYDGYATMGRRPIRAYDHRTLSLLEPSSSSSYRHETKTPVRDYTTSLSRSSSRFRTTSASRSPTNI